MQPPSGCRFIQAACFILQVIQPMLKLSTLNSQALFVTAQRIKGINAEYPFEKKICVALKCP